MPETLEFELVSPEKLLISELVEMVVVPGAEGDLGVLPGHSPLIANVRPGVINIHKDSVVKSSIFVAGGFCEISTDRCTVLATEAILVSEIDREAAEERATHAKQIELDVDVDNRAREKAELDRKIAEAMIAALSN